MTPQAARLAERRVVEVVGGQAEVVVRAEQEHRAAVEHHARALRPADHAQAAVEPQLLELVEALVKFEEEGTLVFVSHDRAFVSALATRILDAGTCCVVTQRKRTLRPLAF